MAATVFVDPVSGAALRREGEFLVGGRHPYPIIADVPRFCEVDNYTASFGMQWNKFDRTQLDPVGERGTTAERFFAGSGWAAEELAGLDVLEVGSGAGRFSRAVLDHTDANLFSVDYSSAVEASWRSNQQLGAGRFHLAQASIYEMPFPDCRFDRVFCFGVLQHTPDFRASVEALVRKAKPGGQIAVDFYPIRGWWTKIHAKYLLRPLTRRMEHQRLLRMIDRNVDGLIRASDLLQKSGLGVLRRFLPLVDIETVVPKNLSPDERREWAVLDTFDMYSPEYDSPETVHSVARMMEAAGAIVEHAGYVPVGGNATAAIVRARKKTIPVGGTTQVSGLAFAEPAE